MSAFSTLAPAAPDLRTARRRLLLDTLGIAVSVAAFGFVFGLAARNAGFSPIETVAFSVVVFAGAPVAIDEAMAEVDALGGGSAP